MPWCEWFIALCVNSICFHILISPKNQSNVDQQRAFSAALKIISQELVCGKVDFFCAVSVKCVC